MRKLDSRKRLCSHSQASTSCSSLWQQEPLRLHFRHPFRDVTSVVTTCLTIFKSHLLHVCSTGVWSHHDNHHSIYRFRFLLPDTHENRFAINPDLQSTHNLCQSSMIKKNKKTKNLLQFQFQEMKLAFHFTGPICSVCISSIVSSSLDDCSIQTKDAQSQQGWAAASHVLASQLQILPLNCSTINTSQIKTLGLWPTQWRKGLLGFVVCSEWNHSLRWWAEWACPQATSPCLLSP